jgi:hypothetical protein
MDRLVLPFITFEFSDSGKTAFLKCPNSRAKRDAALTSIDKTLFRQAKL